MENAESFSLLDASVNAVVARFGSRVYPGMLIQGDTLRIIFDELVELCGELAADNSEGAMEIADGLKERLFDLLCHYEVVLKKNELGLPYPNSVRKDC